MNEGKLKKSKDKGYSFISSKISNASKDYDCYGCCGEVPILKNTEYLVVSMSEKQKDGKKTIHTMRFCQRCMMFIKKKIDRNNGGIFIDKGGLMFHKLGKDDKKVWNDILENYRIELSKEDNLKSN